MPPAKACPRFRFVRTKRHDVETDPKSPLRAVRIQAFSTAPGQDNNEMGSVFIKRGEGPKHVFVSSIAVLQSLERCGIGTALYQEAAKVACNTFRAPLHSDRERSLKAEGFWQKQVRKGRAACTGPAKTPSGDPLPADYVRAATGDGPIRGRNGCNDYKLTCPAPKDLSGLKKKKRRR